MAAPSFEKDIQPILERRCTSCHGDEKQKAGLKLTNLADIMKGGDDGQVVLPGKSQDSLLVKLIEQREKPTMPPAKAGPPLSADEIKLIRDWIDAGAQAGASTPEPAKTQIPTTAPAAAATTTQPAGKMPPQIGSLAFSPDGKKLAVGSLHIVELLDRNNGSVLQKLEGHAENVRALAFNNEGTLLAAAGGQPAVKGEVRIWNLAENKMVTQIDGHQDCIYAVAFSPDGKMLVTASYDRMIYLWDAATGKEIRNFKNHVDSVYDVAFTPNGKRLVSVSADRSVKIWDADSGRHLYNLTESQNILYSLAIHPNGQQIAAAGADRMIRVWTLGETSGKLLNSWFAHEKTILKIAYSPDGSRLYSTAQDGSLKTWDAKTMSELHVFEQQPDWDLALAVAPDNNAIAMGRYDGSLSIYDPLSGKTLFNKTPKRQMAEAQTVLTVATQPTANKTESEKDKFAKVGDFIPANVVAGPVLFPPNVAALSMRAAPTGSTVTISAVGNDLAGITVINFGDKGIRARLISSEAKPKPQLQRVKYNTAAEIVDGSIPYELKFEAEIGYDARPGMHEVLFKSPTGMSGGVPFFVEDLVELTEVEPNDTPATAQPITRAVTVSGAMNKPGDIDYFRIDTKAGQTYVFEVVGSALGSGLNGKLTLTKADGAVLATNREFGTAPDAKLAYEFAEAGTYYLSLTDNEMIAGGFYRLRIEDRIAVTDVFPLGVEKEKTAEIAVEGVGLGGEQKVKVTGIKSPAWGQTIGVPVPGKNGAVLTRWMLAVGDQPEMLETEPNNDATHAQLVTAPVTINGRIFDQSGTDQDFFRFSAKKGQPWVIEVMAQRTGSPLDSFIEVLDANGQRIERATLRAVAKTTITLFERDSQQAGLRLDNWDDLRVNDYVMVGSEIIRVQALPPYNDVDVVFFASRGQRIGYFDTTPEQHAVNAPVYKVEIHPPGKTFPPNGNPVFHLYTENDDGGMRHHGKDSCLTFDPPADGDYLVKIRSATNDSNRHNSYRLTIRPPKPDFSFSVGPGDLNVPEGSNVVLNCSVLRIDDFNGPVHIRFDNLPPGCTASETDVLPDQENAAVIIHADPGAASTLPDWSIHAIATAQINNVTVTREARARTITIAHIKPDVELRIDPPVINLEPGGTAPMTVHVQRNNGFAGRVQIDVLNLPFGVEVANNGLNGILVTENETSRTMQLVAQPWLHAMERRISLTGQPATTIQLVYADAAPTALLRIGPNPEKNPRLVQNVPPP